MEGFDFSDTGSVLEISKKAGVQKKVADALLAEEKLKEKRTSVAVSLGKACGGCRGKEQD